MSKVVCIIEFKRGFTEELVPQPRSNLFAEGKCSLPISNGKIFPKIRFPLRIWVGPNSTLQDWLIRRGLPELYKHYTAHISRQCGTKLKPSHPTQ
ncbi:hypothetical protein MTR_2g062865 [Medicago truncatula]|uniref:Uncharacterized protein n=1 Tax=Medicago truncatula TaxID=3880 RepID=A0A072V8N0_MEDTR|nr:hypothetical protein MTR_2g062865 [Medicago truncatula]